MPEKKKDIEIIKVDLDFDLEEENKKLEEETMQEIKGIIQEKRKAEEEFKDIIDEIVDKLKEGEMTRDELSNFTGKTGSHLSGVVTKLKKRLEKKYNLQLLIEGTKKKKVYKLKGENSE